MVVGVFARAEAKRDKRALTKRELKQIQSKQRQFYKQNLSLFDLLLMITATLLIAALLTSCGGVASGDLLSEQPSPSGQGTNPINPAPIDRSPTPEDPAPEDPIDKNAPTLPAQGYYPPTDTDGNGFLEITEPFHLVALAAADDLSLNSLLFNSLSSGATSFNPASFSPLSLAASYELTKDIDLAEYSNWRPIGDYATPFTGNFNGRGYAVTGISTALYDFAGLFGVTNNAKISNLRLEEFDISGTHYAGALAGFAQSSSISNVTINFTQLAVQTALNQTSAQLTNQSSDLITNQTATSQASASQTPASTPSQAPTSQAPTSQTTTNQTATQSASGQTPASIPSPSRVQVAAPYTFISDPFFPELRDTQHAAGGLVGSALHSNITKLQVIGKGDISSRGLTNTTDSNYLAGGISGLARGSSYSNARLDAHLSITAGDSNWGDSASVGALFGEMDYSSVADASVNFSGQLLARGSNSYNLAGGVFGGLRNTAVRGLKANIASAIMAHPSSEYAAYYTASSVGGLAGNILGTSRLQQINLHIQGDLIGNNTYYPDYVEVGGIWGEGYLHSGDKIHATLDGNLVAIGATTQVAALGFYASNLSNSAVVINGDLITEVSKLNRVATSSFVAGMLTRSYNSRITNISIVVNGDLKTESLAGANTLSPVLNYMQEGSNFTLRDSSVTINGSAFISAATYTAIKFGGFVGDNQGASLSIANSHAQITGGLRIAATSPAISIGPPSPPTNGGGFGIGIGGTGVIGGLVAPATVVDRPNAVYLGPIYGTINDTAPTNATTDINNSSFTLGGALEVYLDGSPVTNDYFTGATIYPPAITP